MTIALQSTSGNPPLQIDVRPGDSVLCSVHEISGPRSLCFFGDAGEIANDADT